MQIIMTGDLAEHDGIFPQRRLGSNGLNHGGLTGFQNRRHGLTEADDYNRFAGLQVLGGNFVFFTNEH